MRTLDGVRRAAPSMLYSLVDQASVSIANFAVVLLLARYLSAEEFGAFTVAYSLFLLLGMVHSALVTEPMLVHSNGHFSANQIEYRSLVKKVNSGFSVLLCIPLALGAGLSSLVGGELTGALLTLALAGPFILFHWTARRACYASLRPALAARADLAYLFLLPGTATVAHACGVLGAELGILLMAVSSMVAGSVAYRSLQSVGTTGSAIARSELYRVHWSFGRWLLASSGLRWVQGNAIIVLAPAYLGVASAGELRVLGLLLMPLSQVLAAVGPPLTSGFARARQVGGLSRKLLGALVALLSIAAAYYAVLLIFGDALLDVAFGQEYRHLGPLLAIYGLSPVFSAVCVVVGAGLHALKRTESVFKASLASAIVAVLVAVIAVPGLGIAGAVLSDVLAAAALGLALTFGLVRALGLYRQ